MNGIPRISQRPELPPPTVSPEAAPGGVDTVGGLFELARKVRKHWRLVIAVTVAFSLGVAFFTLGQKKIYGSTATVYFDPNPPRPLGKGVEMVVDMGSGNYWSNKEFNETQQRLIKSMRVAISVVRDLGLDRDPGFLRNVPRDGNAPPKQVQVDEAARILLERIEVEPQKNTYLAAVKYEDANPERAQRIATAVVDSYLILNMEDTQASTGSAVEWLNSQLDKLKNGLESSELALHEYKLQKNILSLDIDSQSNMLREQMKQLSDALTATRIKREELSARRDELKKIKGEDPSVLPANELLQSNVLQALRQRYSEAVRDRDGMIASGHGANHPSVQSATAQVLATRTALLAEVRNIQGAVERELAVVRRQESGLSGLSETAKRQALDLNLLEIEYKRLARSRDNNEKLYGLVMERAKEADLTRMLRVNNVRIIDRPLLPTRALRPNVQVNLLLGILGGLVFGVAAALLRDLLDRTVKTPEDVEQAVGMTLLGVLPLVNEKSERHEYYTRKRPRNTTDFLGNPELIVHALPRSGIAEAARAIRTNLQFMTPDQPARTILVTSAGPSEGKTTVAFCIAIALAQTGYRVGLLDCDLRRPRVHRVLGRSGDAGITSVLLDDKQLDDEELQTVVPNLFAIPAGPIPPNPAELLQTERFHNVLKQLRGRFDRLIIDSPPILPITDAAVLATQVDGVVIVGRAFKTHKESLRHARRIIESVGGRIFGCVLNAVDLSRVEYKHYYYQYYKHTSYGYGYGEEADSPAAKVSETRT